MLVRIFVLKLVKNERKILTHHETIDRMAEQIKSVITHVRKESKLWIHPNLRRPIFSLTFSFKFTYFCIADIWTLKKELKLQPLKLQQIIKICHKFT